MPTPRVQTVIGRCRAFAAGDRAMVEAYLGCDVV
jgi:hypothetical protein